MEIACAECDSQRVKRNTDRDAANSKWDHRNELSGGLNKESEDKKQIKCKNPPSELSRVL